MKTFGKVLIGLGAFVAGTYAGAFISAYVAEKVMDSPLDESVLRKHARTNKSKLDYTVLYTPKSSDPNLQSNEDAAEDESDDDKSTYYDSLLAFLGVSNALFYVGGKVHIKMKDGVVLRYVRTNDGWVLDSLCPILFMSPGSSTEILISSNSIIITSMKGISSSIFPSWEMPLRKLSFISGIMEKLPIPVLWLITVMKMILTTITILSSQITKVPLKPLMICPKIRILVTRSWWKMRTMVKAASTLTPNMAM